MKNKNRSHLSLLLLVGGLVLIATTQSAGAQHQPRHEDSTRETASPRATTVVYVVGAVRSPARLEFSRSVHLTEVLCCVGGLLPESNNKVRVYRIGPGITERTIFFVDLKKIKKLRASDLILQPYDVVEVASKNRHGGHVNPIPRMGELPARKVN
jgi:hypothetical protein